MFPSGRRLVNVKDFAYARFCNCVEKWAEGLGEVSIKEAPVKLKSVISSAAELPH
jgi:hypothetical protein